MTSSVPEKVRLDKWLWAARFFKTRGLAREAIDGGKVAIGGVKCKPAKQLFGDELISITRGQERFEVKVVALSEQRGPAKIAQTLYEETPESIEHRAKEAELRRLHAQSVSSPQGRPDKRQRRQIHRFKQNNG